MRGWFASAAGMDAAPGSVRPSVSATEVIVDAVPIEAAHTMRPDEGAEPPVFAEFRRLLPGLDVEPLGRFDFYDAARGPDVALAIATGERRIYANILLTIGVVPPPPEA